MLAELAAAEASRVEARRLGEAGRVVAEADLMGLGLKLGLGLGLGLIESLQRQTLVWIENR